MTFFLNFEISLFFWLPLSVYSGSLRRIDFPKQLSGPPSFVLNVFVALKGTHNYIFISSGDITGTKRMVVLLSCLHALLVAAWLVDHPRCEHYNNTLICQHVITKTVTSFIYAFLAILYGCHTLMLKELSKMKELSNHKEQACYLFVSFI